MSNQKLTVLGIDVGGSTTKIGGFRVENGQRKLIQPLFVQATDPITSIYGAFGKFTFENAIGIEDIDRIMVTGGGSGHLIRPLYSLECTPVSEFECVGRGGLFLSGIDEAIVVSMGTGTALIHAKKLPGGKTYTKYLGGTGIGGGTLLGLTRLLTGVDTIDHIETLCEGGDLDKINLHIKDISKKSAYEGINSDLTVSNFGKVSDLATPEDLSLGVANLVGESIAMLAVFAARACGVDNIVLTGNLASVAPVRHVFETLADNFGKNFMIPENARFGTVIGAALLGTED